MTTDDITEMKEMLRKILDALYGEVGRVNGAGCGLVSRVASLEERDRAGRSKGWELLRNTITAVIAAAVSFIVARVTK